MTKAKKKAIESDSMVDILADLIIDSFLESRKKKHEESGIMSKDFKQARFKQ